MRTFLSSLLIAGVLALWGCDTGTGTGNDNGESDAFEGEAVATINGEDITEEQLLHYSIQRTGGDPSSLDPQTMQQLLNELINIELLAQEAREDNLHEQSPLREQIAFQRLTAMADASMTRHLEEQPITDEEVRAEYEERKAELGGTEYKARHILVEEEDTARELINQLDEGAEFAVLAQEHSIEPGASESGGDLGWFSPTRMVPGFANAVQQMEPGERSSEPVQTQFGWHVILVEDVREMEPPPFEEVEEQIRRFMTNQRIQAYLNELRAKAEISQSGLAEEEDGEEAGGEQTVPEA